jgi:hypothetical protein
MVGVNFNNITYPIRRFFKRIKNIFRWLPTIWRDEDYDDHFITEILIKKLEHTRDFFLSDNTHILRAKEVAAEIQEAIDRLHMTRDSWEFYEEPANDMITEKWGETTFDFVPHTTEEDGSVSYYEMKSKTEKVRTPEEQEEYSKDFREAMMDCRKRYEKDKKDAYRFIAKRIDGWWD